jgi:hypothetical protein
LTSASFEHSRKSTATSAPRLRTCSTTPGIAARKLGSRVSIASAIFPIGGSALAQSARNWSTSSAGRLSTP